MDLETTLTQLAPKLLRFCRGLSRDAHLAEEAAQEALTALVSRWRQHGPPDCPDAFAFAIARRRLRRSQRLSRWLEPLERLFSTPSPDPDPEVLTVDRAHLDATLEALRHLPPRLREALLAVAVGELDGASAAVALGISHSALKMRLHRARKQLQQRLDRSETAS